MALLSENSIDVGLSPHEQTVLDTVLPWTRRMVPGETTYHGQRIDLHDFALSAQQQLTLKPSDDYGGRGVILGWDTAPEQWQRELEAADGQAYILQERVEVPEAEFPFWHDGETRIQSLYLDTDPLLFHGKMLGILTRMSGSTLLNVTAGTGSTAPTFVVNGQEE
jgi:hypothetical protein